ncbi:MAG: trypsin-like peptidase domain-containing protein [Bacteroidia bacterium]
MNFKKKNILFFMFCLTCIIQAGYAQSVYRDRPESFRERKADLVSAKAIMPVVDLTANREEDLSLDSAKLPYRFGFNHKTDYTTSNSGQWNFTENGYRIWILHIQDYGAQTINLGFNNFRLGKESRLYVYTPSHSVVLGPYTAAQNFTDREMATDLVTTAELYVELDEPLLGEVSEFTLCRVTHGYRSLDYTRSFGQAGSCIPNVRCPEGDLWADQRRSVICLVTGGNAFCSATLINNTSSDGTPYVLTANHCGTPSGSWVFRFNWESASCATPSSGPPASQAINGAIAIAHNAFSDFALCKMNAIPPSSFRAFYAGWSRSSAPADSVCTIHHPSGDIKKISLSHNPVTAGTWAGASVWQTGPWTTGCTESGSSGAPLFDSHRHLVGQLYSGPSACGVAIAQDYDCFGRFDISWNSDTLAQGRLHDWLDPINTGALTNEGFDPNGAGIQKHELLTMEIFPNPARETALLRLSETLEEASTLTLFSLDGKEAVTPVQLLPGNKEYRIDCSKLNAGIYLVRIQSQRISGTRLLTIFE